MEVNENAPAVTAPVSSLPHKRRLKGVVVSRSGAKSAVVRVSWLKVHPRYKKRISWSKKYQVHDEKDEAKLGQYVEIIECRPHSKTKRFRLGKPVSEGSK